ncbi:tripartite motif-containing protein 60/61 [Pelomyxa schiedti]|nr:tripartite motif-containing protein 60/61 [Pelomyxa schiedti]
MASSTTELEDSLSWDTTCGLCLSPLSLAGGGTNRTIAELHRVPLAATRRGPPSSSSASTPPSSAPGSTAGGTSSAQQTAGTTPHRVCMDCARKLVNNAVARSAFYQGVAQAQAQAPSLNGSLRNSGGAEGCRHQTQPGETQSGQTAATGSASSGVILSEQCGGRGNDGMGECVGGSACSVNQQNIMWSPLLRIHPELLSGPPNTKGGVNVHSMVHTISALSCPICGESLPFPVKTSLPSFSQIDTATQILRESEIIVDAVQGEKKCCPICEEVQPTHSCVVCRVLVCATPRCMRIITNTCRSQGHTFTPIEIGAAKTNLPCPEHNRPLDMFCIKDNIPVCSTCILSGAHQANQHPTITIQQASKERKEIITRQSQELSEKIKVLEEALAAVTKTKYDINENCGVALKDIEDTFSTLELILATRHKQLISECMEIAQTTEKIITLQQDHLERFLETAKTVLRSALKLRDTPHDFGVIRSFDSIERLISALKSQLVYEKPCCKSEINFTTIKNLSEVIKSFGAVTFGVSASMSKFRVTPCRENTPVVGMKWQCMIECTSLVDNTGTLIPSTISIPSLTSAGMCIVVHKGPEYTAETRQFEQVPFWQSVVSPGRNDGEVLKCDVMFIPEITGRHSLVIGGSEVFSCEIKQINQQSTTLVGDLTGTVGNPFKLKLLVHYSDGTPVSAEDWLISPPLMRTRFKITGPLPPNSDQEDFTQCPNPAEIEFKVQSGGEYKLFIQNTVWPNTKDWISMPGSPFLIRVTQVDISKCTIWTLPSSLTVGHKISLPIQMMSTAGNIIPAEDESNQLVEYRAYTSPQTAAIASISPPSTTGSSRVSSVNVEPKMVADVFLSVEGSLARSNSWQPLSGSPFRITITKPQQARKIGGLIASSSMPGYPPERVLNYTHDHTMYWASTGNKGQFLALDLTEPCIVPVVCLRTHDIDGAIKDFTMSSGASSSGPWTVMGHFTAARSKQWQRFPVDPKTSSELQQRWVRLLFDSTYGPPDVRYVVVSGVKFW